MENKELVVAQKLQNLTALVSRANLAIQLGLTYGGERDINQVLGYPGMTEDIKSVIYFGHYKRQDIAKAIIDKPTESTWEGGCHLIESNEPEDTEAEKLWEQLNNDLGLVNKFKRLDKLALLNKYAILLMGFSDVTNVEEFQLPAGGIAPNAKTKLELYYIKPFGEAAVEIHTYDNDTRSKRYGMPQLYKIQLVNRTTNGPHEILIHHTRVIHVVWDRLEDDIMGTPMLEAVYNRLLDLTKLVGGSAEMFWRGARPGYTGTVDEKHEMTQKAEDDLQTQLNEYEHNLRRFLITEGVDIQALAGQVYDPLSHVDVQLQMISAATSIPKRILVGSERGELASTQDQDNWRSIVKARRENWAETAIVRPFITVCMKHGILPFITDYTIRWSDLFAMGEKQKAEVGQIRSTALASYAAQLGAENIVPAEAFFEFFLGLNEDQITLITKMREQRIKDDMIEEEPINEEEE